MKKYFFALLSCLLGFVNAPASAPSPDLLSSPLSPQLFDLLDLTDVYCDMTLPAIVEATQKAWLRKEGTERWEVQESYSPKKQEKIAELCDQMGFFEEVPPTQMHYTYCCIFGAALPSVKARILYAKELWERGIRFDRVVLLTGDRPLDVRIDQIPELDGGHFENETDAIVALYAALTLPEGFRALPVTVVATPKIGSKRPSTWDTLRQWLSANPMPGTCLMVSNQPWVKYQDAVARCSLPEEFPLKTVGAKSLPSYRLRAGVMLDNVARWLYAENQLQMKSK